jgi:SAM-dependent methyltransferase
MAGGGTRRGARRSGGFVELDWYDAPRYYDLIFDTDTAREADFLERMAAAHAEPPARRALRVLEPACGSGRLMVELAARGARVVGFDASAPMLEYAGKRLKERGLKGRLFEARMESFELPASEQGRFDLAHCFVSTFKYLLTEADARSHLERVAAALRPGGIYVLGFHLSDYDELRQSRERWVVEEGGTRVVCTITGWPPMRRARREKVRSRLVVEEGGETKRLETTWDFRTYDAGQAKRLLASVPAFELVAVHDFDYAQERPRNLGAERLDVVLILRRGKDGARVIFSPPSAPAAEPPGRRAGKK